MLSLCLNPPWLPSHPKVLPGLDHGPEALPLPGYTDLTVVPLICQALSLLPLPMLFPPPGTVPSMCAGHLPSKATRKQLIVKVPLPGHILFHSMPPLLMHSANLLFTFCLLCPDERVPCIQ